MATSLVLQLGTRTKSGKNCVDRFSGHLRLVSVIVLLTTVSFIDVIHCVTVSPAPSPAAPAPTQTNGTVTIFNQAEADVMNAVLKKWSTLNPQLSALLKWSPSEHPCNATAVKYFTGQTLGTGWRGVLCNSTTFSNGTGDYVAFKITQLKVIGSNMTCDPSVGRYYKFDPPLCDFMGIRGELPSEVGQLTSLVGLYIIDNPQLTGPVPDAIWQLPKLRYLYLRNNSLNGPLPAANLSRSSGYHYNIDLSFNNFSGSLQLNSSGNTFFSALVLSLNLSNNQLVGSVDFQGLYTGSYTGPSSLFLNNNNFTGTFSTGPYFNPYVLDLSNNGFTNIKFSYYIDENSFNTSYMPLYLNC